MAVSPDGRQTRLTSGFRIGGSIYVVPRGECQFVRKLMPRRDSKGREAARQQGRFESRFETPDVFVTSGLATSGPGELSVWTWDASALARAVGKAGVRAMPETLAREGLENGLRLVRCFAGFEGEVWDRGELLSTRWWRSIPSIEEWRGFLAGARTESPAAAVWQSDTLGDSPRLSVPEWRANVFWTDDGAKGLARRVRPAHAAAAILVLGAAPLGFNAFKWGAAISDRMSVEPALAAAQEESRSWVALSRRAARDAEVAAQSAAFGDSTAVLRAMEEFGQALGEETSVVRQIKLDGGSLQITLDSAPKQDLVALVSRLEAASSWKSVRMESEGRTILGEIENGGPAENADGGAAK